MLIPNLHTKGYVVKCLCFILCTYGIAAQQPMYYILNDNTKDRSPRRYENALQIRHRQIANKWQCAARSRPKTTTILYAVALPNPQRTTTVRRTGAARKLFALCWVQGLARTAQQAIASRSRRR